MKAQQQDHLREMQLAFVGKMMAGLSHEFKNHLAIIKELSGLVEDLLLLEESGGPADRERLRKNIAGINERIAQAAEMCRFLSSFSHRMDQALSSFSVTEVLQEEIYLLRRFAWQKQVRLDSSFAENVPLIFNDPALLQFAIFCIVWPSLALLEKDGRIMFGVNRQGTSVAIVLGLDGGMKKPPEGDTWQEVLPEVLQRLEADYLPKTLLDGSQEYTLKISSIQKTTPHETD